MRKLAGLLVLPLLLGSTVPAEASGIRWSACADTELAAAGAECATVRVPLDHLKPDGRTVDLAISRIKADPAQRRGVLLSNPGGPGGPGLAYPLALKPLLGEVAQRYDLIGVDVRFTGQSDPLDCGPVRVADVYRSSTIRSNFEESSRLAARFVANCRARSAGLLEHASIRNAARDLDVIRTALGAPTISYYGVSWGADLGVVYSQLFPGRVDRMVVDSVTDVEGSEYRHLATGERSEAALDEWAAWVAWRDGQYHLGRTGTQVRATLLRLLADAHRRPIRIGGHRIDAAALPWLLGHGDESERDKLARTVRTLLDAAAGKPVQPGDDLLGWLDQYYNHSEPLAHFIAASAAYTCNDNGWPDGPTQYWRDARRDRRTQPFFAFTYLPCAYWQDHTQEPGLTINNLTPILIIQATRDNIPLAWAEALHRKLPNSTLETVDRRAHGVYDTRVPEMVTAVNQYLAP